MILHETINWVVRMGTAATITAVVCFGTFLIFLLLMLNWEWKNREKDQE